MPGAPRRKLLNNADWLTTISLTDFLRDVGKHFTVNQMMAKESVKSRLDRDDVGLSFTEFSYMLLQAYDFLRLNLDHGCTLQLGGSDQWGNITVGTELVRKSTGESAYGLTSPLLLRADGTQVRQVRRRTSTCGSTPTTHVAVHDAPVLVNSDDEITPSLLRYFTFLDHETIRRARRGHETAPRSDGRNAPSPIAVVAMVHGEEAAAQSRAGQRGAL